MRRCEPLIAVKMFVVTLLLFLSAMPARASEAEVVMVTLGRHGELWDVELTLRHADNGWKHYADAWRIVTAQGRVLATRTLYHPHDEEQPFTRSLSDVRIPADISIVFIEAHDNVTGWSQQRVEVDLTKPSGKRYRINSRSP